MTGNTSKWRAPLAGLASIAMLATMGVAATTANAASLENLSGRTFSVNVYNPDEPWKPITGFSYSRSWGYVLNPSANVSADPYASDSDGKVFDYFSYDKAGNNRIGDVLVVKGDTKVFAQYKTAVKVNIDFAGNGFNGAGDDVTVEIPKGESLTASEYQRALAKTAGLAKDSTGEPAAIGGKTFAGLTESRTAAGSNDDLYQGEALNADTNLYGRYDAEANLATVAFRGKGEADSAAVKRYTLNGNAFPKFRVPAKFNGVASWKLNSSTGSDYDFSAKVNHDTDVDAGKADVTLVASDEAGLRNVTVKYVYKNGATETGNTLADSSWDAANHIASYATTADQKPVKPVDPVAPNAVFTGWYTNPNADGTSHAVNWDAAISAQQGYKANGTLTLYAGWDTSHVAQLHYDMKYVDGGNQYEYVYAGSKHDLPAGLEEYYQTEAQKDALKGEYTSKTLVGWYLGDNGKDVVTSVTAPAAGESAKYTAVWSGSQSIRLNANSGKFDGQTYKWVTKTDSQRWQDVVVNPTRDGYTLTGWTYNGGSVNLYSGTYDLPSTAGFDNLPLPTTGSTVTLDAVWVLSAAQDIDAAFGAYPLANEGDAYKTPTFANKSADYKLAEKYAKTQESWNAYVDTVYGLKDEFHALYGLSGQEKIDAQKALAAKLQAAQDKLVDDKAPAGTTTVYRLFNPNEKRAGSHHYTASVYEYNALARKGWVREGVAFVTTSDGDPVYRAYNPNDGSHFYTLSKVEFNHAVKAGWRDEGIGFHVADTSKAPLYRIYNPNSGEHFYTTSKGEAKADIAKGWNDEGIAWNVIK
ncbi:InlB B-repeat-containing protein [Bifidobacterium callitrichos]|nr:InlB B-repeat-containing protein [Bifidobacterium callitrichos]